MPIYSSPLRASVVEADLAAIAALQDIHDYEPHSGAYTTEIVVAKALLLEQAQEHEARIARTMAAARDARQAAEWGVHETMLGIKAEVMAQYGANSDEVQGLGLKKKLDYKRPTRRSSRSKA